MQAQYLNEITSVSTKVVSSPRSFVRSALLSTIALAVALLFLAAGPLKAASVHADEKEGFDPIRWSMCVWGDDSLPATMYQVTQSSDLQFETRSKSTMNFGTDRVDNGLNAIMQLFGPDYVEVNKEVIGRVTNAEYKDKKDDEEELEFNSGPQVNPFDRFGVAGLKFTGYTGEWKHVIIDACDPKKDPVDPKSNLYYDDRLEPRSTWEDISKSEDIRTQQFSKGLPSQYGQAIGNVLANWVFIIPKSTVVLTVALINFSFADVGEKLGVVDLLVGKDGQDGVFTTVFESLYIPLLATVMLIFAAWIIVVGMWQQRARAALMGVLRSFLMILVAFVIAANPGPVINAPNSIAVMFQSMILSSMDRSLESQGELCNTDIGAVETKIDTSDSDDDQETLAEAAGNIRSVVGCTFWQMFLVTPWAESQWGTDWNNLWVKDKIPDWAPEDSDSLKNTNDDMVGDAAVPLGDGKFVHNWAIFQISAQTDAHSPIGDDGGVPKYSSGVSTDWWRIVDATSNYQEVKVKVDGESASNTGGDEDNSASQTDADKEDAYWKPDTSDEAKPVDEWDTWAGNSAWSRIAGASSAALIAGIGLLAPFILSLLTSSAALGSIILMAFAPLMLLLGAGPGRMFDVFKSWVKLVVDLTITRIALGILLVLSIIFTMIAIDTIGDEGWWKGMMLLVLGSILIIKARPRFVAILTDMSFNARDISGGMRKISGGAQNIGRAGMRGATTAVAGGVNSKRYGGSFTKGALVGARNELKNQAYRNKGTRSALATYETMKHNMNPGSENFSQEFCALCGKSLGDANNGRAMIGGRDGEGNYYCQDCYEDGAAPQDTREVILDNKEATAKDKKAKADPSVKRARKSSFENDAPRQYRDSIANDPEISDEDREVLLKKLASGISYEIVNYQHALEEDSDAPIPEIPSEIRQYVDYDMIERAWKTQNFEYVQGAYSIAWATWFEETTGQSISESISTFVSDIGEVSEQVRQDDLDSRASEIDFDNTHKRDRTSSEGDA